MRKHYPEFWFYNAIGHQHLLSFFNFFLTFLICRIKLFSYRQILEQLLNCYSCPYQEAQRRRKAKKINLQRRSFASINISFHSFKLLLSAFNDSIPQTLTLAASISSDDNLSFQLFKLRHIDVVVVKVYQKEPCQ